MWSESDEYTVFNGIMLIGMCNCGCQGCNDLVVEISTNERTVEWKIIPYSLDKMKLYIFDINEYKKQITKLTEKYYSYSWETEFHKINRVCTEFIRKFKTKDGFNIDGVRIKKEEDINGDSPSYYNKTMKIYYYANWEKVHEGYAHKCENIELEWDGKTIENALKVLGQFAHENLVENPNKVNSRPYPFHLVYTKDEEQLKEIGFLKE
jgi:hypothetical protein